LIFLYVRPEENITLPTPTSIYRRKFKGEVRGTREIPNSSVLQSLRGKMVGKSTARMETTVATKRRLLWFVTNPKLIK
jgi:hypothetical protein